MKQPTGHNTHHNTNQTAPETITRPSLSISELDTIITALQATGQHAAPLTIRLYTLQQQAILRQSVASMRAGLVAQGLVGSSLTGQGASQDSIPQAQAEPLEPLESYTSTTLFLEGVPLPQHKILYELLAQAEPEPYAQACKILDAHSAGLAAQALVPLEQLQAGLVAAAQVAGLESTTELPPAEVWAVAWITA